MKQLTPKDFKPVNFGVIPHEIDGGFLEGGTSVILNCQNSNKLFIDGPGVRFETPISDFDDGIGKANKYFAERGEL